MLFLNKMHRSHDNDMATEGDKPPVAMLSIAMTLLCVFLIVAVVGSYYVVFFKGGQLLTDRVYSVPNAELVAIKQRDAMRLSVYGLIDAQKQTYQIPIERAMELVAADSKLTSPRTEGP